MYEMICVVISGLTFRVGVVCAILEEHGFNRGFTRGTTDECQFGSELLSNKDQCTRCNTPVLIFSANLVLNLLIMNLSGY